MAVTPVLKPKGIQPVGGGSLNYTFTEGSIAGKPNYRLQISVNGYAPILEFRPDATLLITCDVAPLLRGLLKLSEVAAQRFLAAGTYVKYQTMWDGGTDGLTSLSGDVILPYIGIDTYFNHRTKFSIDLTGGKFLLPTAKLYAWADRTGYVEFINPGGLPNPCDVDFIPVNGGGSQHIGSYNGTVIGLNSFGYKFSRSGIVQLADNAWTPRTPASSNSWESVTYGNGLFVAVSSTGVGNRVMTSPDGIAWTSRASAYDATWLSVTYGNGLFVAVAATGPGNHVMTSPDGITWTDQVAAAIESWLGVTYGNGLFVAVATSGGIHSCMTSPDGITWTIGTCVASGWNGITFARGLFVAVSFGPVMTSPDGINWTSRPAPGSQVWQSVVYGNGVFVAVSNGFGSGNRVMTSPDGITWTSGVSAADYGWESVTFGNGRFVAVALNGGAGLNNRVMTSPDGFSWTLGSIPDQFWISVVYGGGKFVAVAHGGAGNIVATNTGVFAQLPVEVRPECKNPVYVKWLNMEGGISCWLFDFNQIMTMQPQEIGVFLKKQVYAGMLASDAWILLQSLNRDGVEYGNNLRSGQYVLDFTDEVNTIAVLPIPQLSSHETREVQSRIQFTFRYPLINNITV